MKRWQLKKRILKIIVKEISQVKSLKVTLEKTCNMFDVEFENSMLERENSVFERENRVFETKRKLEEAVILISKYTALKRKSNEKKGEI